MCTAFNERSTNGSLLDQGEVQVTLSSVRSRGRASRRWKREARRLRAAELLRAGQSHQNDQVVLPRIPSAYSASVPTP
jgi:hypothetical protein